MNPAPETPPRFQPASDQSLLITFGDKITIEGHEKILKLLQLFKERPIPEVRNLHPAYCSLLVKFDALKIGHAELEDRLHSYLEHFETIPLPESRLVQIPVCYGGEFGPDLEQVADLHGVTSARIVELHSATEYLVYFLGFVPGFAYLGQLLAELETPRFATPRRAVPAGSVGIAGRQTGVYPFATPGGWRLLGRTPLAMFQALRDPMSLLSIGDRVRFTPISQKRFTELVNS